jgi:hypothetical protein
MGSISFASAAHAQLLDYDFTTSRSASGQGLPQVVQGSPTAGTFNPNGGPVTVFSFHNAAFDSFPVPFAGDHSQPGFLQSILPNVALTLVNGQLAYPVAAQAAASSHQSFHVGTIDDVVSILRTGSDTSGAAFQPGRIDYNDSCFRQADAPANTFFPTTGLDRSVGSGPCDAADLKLKMNGVAFEVTSPENKTFLTLSIPAIGYTFTGNGPLVHSRTESFSQISDNLFASGKSQDLVRALLNKPAGFSLPLGSLPTGSKLLAGSIEVLHPNGSSTLKTFGVDSFGELLAYAVANHGAKLTDFGVSYSDHCARAGGLVSGTCDGFNATLRVLGLSANVTAAPNSPDASISIPSIDYSFTSKSAANRDDAAAQFSADAKQKIDFAKLAQAAARNLAVENGNDPLLGNPNSLQGQLTRADLNLDTPSPALGETRKDGRAPREGAPSGWMVGGRAGQLSAGSSEATFVDADAEYGLRLREGDQSRLKFSAPLTVIDYGSGGTVFTGAARVGYETPLLENRWVVEPSAAVGVFYGSNDLLNSGAVYSLGLSSRFKIAPVGRGHIIIGNSITYSSSIVIHTKGFATPEVSNTAYRNGIAYQVPIGERILGRMGTLRVSYTLTNLTGAEAFLNKYHEICLSYGIGSREVAVRQRAEVLRIGLSTAFGKNYTAGGLVVGYVF